MASPPRGSVLGRRGRCRDRARRRGLLPVNAPPVPGRAVVRAAQIPGELLEAAVADVDALDTFWIRRDAGTGWSGIALVAPRGDVSAVDYVGNDVRGDWLRTDLLDGLFGLGALVDWLDGLGLGTCGHVRALRLDPRSAVGWHRDNLPDGVVRLHVPLVTHPEAVFFDAGGGRHHLAAGYVWQVETRFPHRIEHRAMPGTAPPRVHLVADVEALPSSP